MEEHFLTLGRPNETKTSVTNDLLDGPFHGLPQHLQRACFLGGLVIAPGRLVKKTPRVQANSINPSQPCQREPRTCRVSPRAVSGPKGQGKGLPVRPNTGLLQMVG